MDQKVENLSPKFSNISFINIESFFIICLYFFFTIKVFYFIILIFVWKPSTVYTSLISIENIEGEENG